MHSNMRVLEEERTAWVEVIIESAIEILPKGKTPESATSHSSAFANISRRIASDITEIDGAVLSLLQELSEELALTAVDILETEDGQSTN